MMRVTVPLSRDERRGLMQLAKCKKRDERNQAAIIIRRELERLGLLQPDGGRGDDYEQ